MIDGVELYFDGACEPKNPGGIATWGFQLVSNDFDVKKCGVIGEGNGMTNNVAEYNALIFGMKEAIRIGVKNIKIKGDSQLAVKQILGEWQVNAPLIKPLCFKARSLYCDLLASIFWIPREKNIVADQLSHSAFVNYCREKGYNYQPCECGGTFVLRNGRNGKFFGCSRFPKCRNTKQNNKK